MSQTAQGYEMLGWAMMTQVPPSAQVMSLLDMVDQTFSAFEAGRDAGLAGHLVGECPCQCHALRRAWGLGHAEGERARRAAVVRLSH